MDDWHTILTKTGTSCYLPNYQLIQEYMSRQKKFSMWMTNKEYERLKLYAEKEQGSIAEVLRDYIKILDPLA